MTHGLPSDVGGVRARLDDRHGGSGDLRWYHYSGHGEHDPGGGIGWHPRSGKHHRNELVSGGDRGGSGTSHERSPRLGPDAGTASAGPLCSSACCVPSRRRVFTDQTIDAFAQQVGVSGVPAVLLD